MQTVLIGDHGLPQTADAAHVHFHSLTLAPALALVGPPAGGIATPTPFQGPDKGLAHKDLPQEP